MAPGLTRPLTLSTTKVFTDGERINGDYVISIQGLVSETLETSGAFSLARFIVTPFAPFSEPATRQTSQAIEFQYMILWLQQTRLQPYGEME